MEGPALWLSWLAGGAVAVVVAHQVLLWLERRGWLYYVNSKRSGRVSLAMAAVIDPAARQVQELQEQEVAEAAEPGEPPTT